MNTSIANMRKMAAEYKAKAEVDRAMMDLNKPMSEKNSDIAEALAAVGWLSTALEWKDLVGLGLHRGLRRFREHLDRAE